VVLRLRRPHLLLRLRLRRRSPAGAPLARRVPWQIWGGRGSGRVGATGGG
jgi:hypothetical protein